jgi:hypothetical protein
MKKSLILGVLVITILLSCKKETPIVNNPLPDQIYYRDISPDTTFNSVQYYLGNGEPFPKDTSVSFSLDIDSNFISDYKFSVNHYFYKQTSHDKYYHYINQVKSLSPTDSIAVISKNSSNALALKEGDIISNNLNYSNAANLLLNLPGVPISYVFSGKYLVIKRSINNTTMLGWIKLKLAQKNGLTIEEFAFNKTNNNSIICGQK